jgi:flagellar hook assembly protein FlgD
VLTTRSDAAGTPPPAPLARIAVALLVLATLAALLIAQHLKHEGALVQANAVWHPTSGFDPQTTTERFNFRTSYDDHVTVSVVSSATGKVVAVIARELAVSKYARSATLAWNGRTRSGAPAPSGNYTAQVHFDRLDRTATIPQLVFKVKDAPR